MSPTDFQQLLRQKGELYWRDMPWRTDTQPYYVLVSELMLQQTQVARVIPKFQQFTTVFGDVQALADAPLADVLTLWQGLGYNRRAKFLHAAAKMIVNEYGGTFPEGQLELMRLPGVGGNTAGAIVVYAFNQPAVFVETNIRTVYLHHFFADQVDVADSDIRAKLETTIDHTNPRRFYQALMDYGSWLKANGAQNVTRSKHYKKQSKLGGSMRQMRGEIIRRLAAEQVNWREDIEHDERFDLALQGLLREGLIEADVDDYRLTR